MTRTKSALICLLVCSFYSSTFTGTAVAQTDLLDVWEWNSSLTGSQDWQNAANWPNRAGFPNNPGYVDPSEAVISNSTAADVMVPLGSDLNLNVGATDVTVAALRLGGTAGAVTTDVSGTTGKLVFENFEQTDNTDPDNPIFPFNRGNALIVSGGTSGSINTISAPLFINKENLEIGSDGTNNSTNSLTITGEVTFAGGAADGTQVPSIRSLVPAGLQVELTDRLALPDNNPSAEGDPIAIDFGINNNTTANQGRLILSGGIEGNAHVTVGAPVTGGTVFGIGTVELPAASPDFSGRIMLHRGNLVLGDDEAIGTATFVSSVATGQVGANLISTDDSRNVGSRIIPGEEGAPDVLDRNQLNMSQYLSVKGDHSLEWSGLLQMTNSRGWINLLPTSKELVISGPQFIEDEDEVRQDLHELSFDGSGRTRITGVIANHQVDPQFLGSIVKRGSGAAYLQGSVTQSIDPETGAPLAGTFNVNTFSGDTEVHGGTLHLAALAEIGNSRAIVSRGGGIGLENGTVTGPDTAGFFGKLNNRANANRQAVLAQIPFPGGSIQQVANDFVDFAAFDTGGLMLAADEYDENLNFTSGNLVNAQNMSLAAREAGTTTSYSGTITPFQQTYRLGGGGGTLELANQNQLTNDGGNRNLIVQNGLDRGATQRVGMVRLSNTNNYSGTTRIEGKWLTTNQENGEADETIQAATNYRGSTLAVTSLGNGGQASSIGNSSSDAANLVIQGSTLRYEGGATSTNRLFTIGTYGGAIDASGTGALTFSSTGAVSFPSVGTISGDTMGDAWVPGQFSDNALIIDLATTRDIVPGMTVSGQGLVEDPNDDDETLTVIDIASESRIHFSDGYGNTFQGNGNSGTFTANNDTPLTFGTVDRDFILKGENTGDNTFAPLIADSAASGDVHLVKQGSGKWIVTNSGNAYSDTVVEEGTLSITSAFLTDDADVLLSSGAIFDLDFTGTDTISALFFNELQQAAGTWGSLASSADNKRSWFTGLGILNVTEALVVGDLGGDFNRDGIVDAADYTVWRDNLGDATDDALNGNGDGVPGIDSADYALWKMNFGMLAPPPEGAGAAVPEPTAMLLLLFGCLTLATRRR